MGVPRSWPAKKRDAALTGVVRPTGRPDWDNLAKSGLDALNGIVFADDSQVVEATVKKVYSEVPLLRIEVSILGLWDDVSPYDAEDDLTKSIEFS
jgi:Holliday junction resolvase RusA-like endonuclease